MQRSEEVELTLILLTIIACWIISPAFPTQLQAGNLLLYASALLLLQSLIRDLWLLSTIKRRLKPITKKSARCMCIESTVGIIGIATGAMLLGFNTDTSITMHEWLWSTLVIVVLSFGFLVKDYVLEWSPWRIRRDKNHLNIVFTWKPPD